MVEIVIDKVEHFSEVGDISIGMRHHQIHTASFVPEGIERWLGVNNFEIPGFRGKR